MDCQDNCLPFQKPVKHNLSCDDKCKKQKPCLNVVQRGRQNDCEEHHHESCPPRPHCKKDNKCDLHVIHHCADDHCHKPHHDSDSSSESCSSSSSSSCSSSSSSSRSHCSSSSSSSSGSSSDRCVCGHCSDA